MKILITGGAGFIGSYLAVRLRRESTRNEVWVLDNLHRRGSELNLEKLKKEGIHFIHGDIRNREDLADLNQSFDLFIECSAEPSVAAGLDGAPGYVIRTNLVGTLNCLEFARTNCGIFLFLSTSKVYSIEPLRELPISEGVTRFEWKNEGTMVPGASRLGITETFATHLPRSLYGATKLSSELMIQEYAYTYGLKSIINRCGIIAGPGQFGKTDQGVFTLWVIHHCLGKSLSYTGFGGEGKQVRDLLHPEDLFTLIQKQVQEAHRYSGQVFNVGGGEKGSLSLSELTTLCRKVTGNTVLIDSVSKSNIVDVPWYVSDTSKAQEAFSWTAKRTAQDIVREITDWVNTDTRLKPLFL